MSFFRSKWIIYVHNDVTGRPIQKLVHATGISPHDCFSTERNECFMENVNYVYDKTNQTTYRWFKAKPQYLQCVSNEDTAVLHQTIGICLPIYLFQLSCEEMKLWYISPTADAKLY